MIIKCLPNDYLWLLMIPNDYLMIIKCLPNDYLWLLMIPNDY